MKDKAATFFENACESGCACLVTMVQGNVLALTLAHWITASQTGLLAGFLASAAIVVTKIEKRWLVSIVLGFVTAAADFAIHPGSFTIGGVSEAVVTGAAAAALSFSAGAVARRWLARRKAGLRRRPVAS